MKRIAFALCVVLALSVTGCASMWKTMGVATEKSVADRDEKNSAQLAEIQKSVDDLSTKVAAAQGVAADVARVEKMVRDLQGRVDQLPQDTLKKLAQILSKASAELDAQDAKN
jgi:TolA-binding protein